MNTSTHAAADTPDATGPAGDVHAIDPSPSRLFRFVSQTFCGLHGHDLMVRFGHERMWLECAMCGYATAGWSIDQHEPRKPPVEGPTPVDRRAAA